MALLVFSHIYLRQLLLYNLLSVIFVRIEVSHDVLFWADELEAAREVCLRLGREDSCFLRLDSNHYHPPDLVVYSKTTGYTIRRDVNKTGQLLIDLN